MTLYFCLFALDFWRALGTSSHGRAVCHRALVGGCHMKFLINLFDLTMSCGSETGLMN